MSESCLFCKIIAGEIPSKKVQENDSVIVINDIAPKAPTHFLIIPKKHIIHIGAMTGEDVPYITEIVKMAHLLSKKLPSPQAFNLISNNGEEAGQSVFHLHWHFLSGKNIYEKGGFSL